jgi:hypothetical protein
MSPRDLSSDMLRAADQSTRLGKNCLNLSQVSGGFWNPTYQYPISTEQLEVRQATATDNISQVLHDEMQGFRLMRQQGLVVNTRPYEEAVAHAFTTGVSSGHTVQRTRNKDEGRGSCEWSILGRYSDYSLFAALSC